METALKNSSEIIALGEGISRTFKLARGLVLLTVRLIEVVFQQRSVLPAFVDCYPDAADNYSGQYNVQYFHSLYLSLKQKYFNWRVI